MKVIITERFEKEYLSKMFKYFEKEDLINDLKEKKHKIISLHDPFFKFKSKLNLVDFRGVLSVFKGKQIIPLFIFLKKDKKYGENITWKNHEKLIEKEFNLSTKDIENGNFEVF